MKPTTWRRRRKPAALPPNTHPYLWWAQVVTTVVHLGTPLVVFTAAGGDFNAPDTLPGPLGLAVLTLAATLTVNAVAAHEARSTERASAEEWYAQTHPELAPGPEVADKVQKILLEHGPLSALDIVVKLRAGGLWGAPVRVTTRGLRRFILAPGGDPAPWLAPHDNGEPWSHVDRPYQPTTAEPEMVERAGLDAAQLP